MRSITWLFDVDGTLTPPAGKMSPRFAAWFLEFARSHRVYLVTGGDHERMRHQLGDELLDAVRACWCCLGNARWEAHRQTACNTFALPADVRSFLQHVLQTSAYPLRTGGHVEERDGLVNFSVVGRNATPAERAHYLAWDRSSGERLRVLAELKRRFPGLDAQLGGEISCDIFPLGHDKSQVLAHLPGPVQFFGDQMGPTGVDFPLARALRLRRDGSVVHEVRDWQQTEQLLLALTVRPGSARALAH